MSSVQSRPSWNLAKLNPTFHTAILAFLVLTLCYLSAKLAGVLIMNIPQTVSPLWPGCALVVAILLLVPRKTWLVLLPAGLAGFVFYDLQAGLSISSIAWLILADIMEILVAAWGVSYALNGLPGLNNLKAFAKYSFFTVFLASLIVSSIGIHALSGDRWLNWRLSFLSEALAFLTVTPAIIGLLGRGRPSLRTSRAYYLEAATLIAGLTFLSYVMFVAPGRSAPPALLYSLVPFLIWSALRFGSAGVGTSATMVALMSIWGAVHGRGPFTETDPINRVLFLQLFLLFTSIPFMVLAVLVEERRSAQEELRKSEERLRSAMESGKAVGWEWNLKTGRDAWFGDLKTMFGIPAETYVGPVEDFFRYVHPEDRQHVSEAVADSRNNHRPYAAEFRIVWPNGNLRWATATGHFYYSPNGEPERMLGMAHDITELKLVEQALRQSEADLTEAQRLANVGSWQWDPQTDTVTWSEQLYRIAALDPSLPAVSYKDHPTLYTAESWLRLSSVVEEALRTGTPYELDLEMSRADGTRRWIVAKGEVRRDDMGRIVQLRGTAHDITERIWEQDELRKSEEKYRRIVETTNEGIWLLDSNFHTSFVNRQMAEMLGYQPGEMLGRSVFDFYFPEDAERKRQVLARRRDGLSEHFDDRFRRRDGAELWVRMAAIPIFKDNGEFNGALAMVSDITERRRAEEALQKSEEKFSKAFRLSPMALALTRARDHRYIDVNESFERTSGWHRDEIIGRTPFELRLWVDEEERSELTRQVQTEGSLRLSESRFRMRDGTIRTGLLGAELIELDGEPCVLAVGMDITELKHAEEALRESEERFRLVANTAPMLIWMSDTDKLCTYFNHSWLVFTGRPMESELGNGWAEGVHPEDLQRCFGTYTRAFDAREKFRSEYRLRRYDGEYRWVLDIGVPRFNQDGSFAGYIGSCVDVTERKLAEVALSGVNSRLIEAQERERTRIARELHDDIGQRLAMLTIELEQFRQKCPNLPVDLLHRIGELRNQSSDLASDVQSLSHELHSSKLEYLGIASAMSALCKEFSHQQNVEVVFAHDEVPRTLPKEISLCLFRVLQEALQNAMKHSGVRHFDVELRYGSDVIRLTVRDSGSGFDVAGAMNSHGLGLVSMTERLKLVDGQLSIDSQPQHGTTIRANVPLSKAARASA